MYIQIELRELWVKRKELMYEPFYPGASLVPSLPRFFLGEVTSRRIQKCLSLVFYGVLQPRVSLGTRLAP